MKTLLNKIILFLFVFTLSSASDISLELEYDSKQYMIHYKNTPTRVVLTSHFMTEMFLALELDRYIVGTSWGKGVKILPKLKKRYNKIPILSEGCPSKEIFYSLDPDFVSGWKSTVDSKKLGPTEELIENGINPYIINSIKTNSNIEEVYSDFINLGHIFKVEKKSEKIVFDMKKSIQKIEDKVYPLNHSKILIFDTKFIIGGSGLGNDIINKAGGQNVFSHLKGNYSLVTLEKIVEVEPEYIMLLHYNETDGKEKMKVLKENEILSKLQAVKENKILLVNYADISPGIRIPNTIKKIAKFIHPEVF